MPPSVVAALRVHKVRQLEERLGAGGGGRSTIGTPPDRRTVVRNFSARRGGPGYPTCDGTTCATRWVSLVLAQGVGTRTAMEILGRRHIGLAINTYAHVVPDLKREVADRIGRPLTVSGSPW